MDEDMGVMDLSAPVRRTESPVNYSSPRSNVTTPVLNHTTPVPSGNGRRNLRRAEPRNFNPNNPDQIMMSDDESTPKSNGYGNGVNGDSDTDEDVDMPELPPMKELTPAEISERERLVRLLRDELRNEEMTLVLLKKLRQSQQMKENIAVVPPSNSQISSSVTLSKVPPPATSNPTLAQTPTRSSSQSNNSKPNSNMTSQHHRGQTPSRNSNNLNIATPLGLTVQPTNGRSLAPGMPAGMHPTSVPNHRSSTHSSRNNHHSDRNSHSFSERSSSKDSLTISVSNQVPSAQQNSKERARIDDGQTPAQRQAAAKLALRKQLEKTLLQIPPPKPPPPEMHFIPNPSNTEFIYLLGLEHIVDFITKDNKTPPPPPEPFKCSQCDTSFTPVWKWEKSPSKGRDPKVICEQCVTTNVKKALKAEHTHRLKTAFVKALQQEQEIEQRLAQASPSPVVEPPPPPSTPKPKRSNPTPPTPQPVPTPPPPRDRERERNERERDRDRARERERERGERERDRESHREHREPRERERQQMRDLRENMREQQREMRDQQHRDLSRELREHPLAKLAAETSKFSPQHAMAAAALHQQLLRGLPPHQQIPAHMLPFSPLLYPYQLAMAQAASSGSKNSVAAAAANLAELQRQAADLQRQYLLDMIPNPNNHGSSRHHNMSHNWK